MGRPPSQCRWFSIVIAPSQAPWLFGGAKASSRIASAELLATLACVNLFNKPSGKAAQAGAINLTSANAYTDNRGNCYAAAKLLSTKYSLNCVVMELATQMEERQLWLDLYWTPRESNTVADKLTAVVIDPAEFPASNRVGANFADLGLGNLDKLLAAGADLEAQRAVLARRQKSPAAKKLRVDKTPWA